MNLEKLLDMQKTLDERIIKEKGLEGQDLFPNTVLALQVELAEFANEGRWFKHWSNNKKPRVLIHTNVGATVENAEYLSCSGCGRKIEKDDVLFDIVLEDDTCPDCKDYMDLFRKKNPLLEEFVDGVHFFLSIANQKGWKEALWVYEEQINHTEYDGDLTAYYLEMIYFLNKSYMEKYPDGEKIAGFHKTEYFFRMAWILFLNLGINGFGFTLEQIESAYCEKNAENHSRQNRGY
jgi:dimeric dUTPase (all-alpha-NTP-PPase superfamily)